MLGVAINLFFFSLMVAPDQVAAMVAVVLNKKPTLWKKNSCFQIRVRSIIGFDMFLNLCTVDNKCLLYITKLSLALSVFNNV